ncbi:hypothetical protein HDU80_007055 [Chytriomyces hyalinus]|nr:hypothetical protein HDU80_007055 [Chytriomyces hyalinus]
MSRTEPLQQTRDLRDASSPATTTRHHGLLDSPLSTPETNPATPKIKTMATSFSSSLKRAFKRNPKLTPDPGVMTVDVSGSDYILPTSSSSMSRIRKPRQSSNQSGSGTGAESSYFSGRNEDSDARSTASNTSRFSLRLFRNRAIDPFSSQENLASTASISTPSFLNGIKKKLSIKSVKGVIGGSKSTVTLQTPAAPPIKEEVSDNEAVETGRSLKARSKSISSDSDSDITPIVISISPLKTYPDSKLASSQSAYQVKNHPHRSSLDRRLDDLYQSQATLGTAGSCSSLDTLNPIADNPAESFVENESTRVSQKSAKASIQSRALYLSRDSLATARNSAAPAEPNSATNLARHSSNSKAAKIGVNVDAILESLETIAALEPADSIADFPRPLLHADSSNSSESRNSSTNQFLRISCSNPSPRFRSSTFNGASGSQPSRFKNTPTNASNALDRLGVECMTSTPYSWWWLSGLSGDSTMPDSFGFAEPTFHERTSFNTEGKRPGFKRLVLGSLKRFIGVGSSSASELNTESIPTAGSNSSTRIESQSPQRVSHQEISKTVGSGNAFETPLFENYIISTDPRARRLTQTPEPDLHRHEGTSNRQSTTSRKTVAWTPGTLAIGESWLDSEILDVHLEHEDAVLEPPAAEATSASPVPELEISGMQKIRRRSTRLNKLEDHFKLDEQAAVHSGKRELEELDASILRFSATTRGDHPFVKALILQRERLVNEMEQYYV